MAVGYDTDVGGYDVQPYDQEGGAGLTLVANPFLDRPSVLWAFDIYFASSFPITFPWTFDAEPFHVSSLDLYPGGVLTDVLYEARLLEKPVLARGSADVFGGLEQVEQVKLRLSGRQVESVAMPNLHVWVTGEHRGKVIAGHLLELDRKFRVTTIARNVFVGEIVAMSDDPRSVSILARAFDLASLTQAIPASIVATRWAAYAPSGSLGRVVPIGIGIGRRIPLVPVKAQTADSTLFAETFTADAGTDLVTITDHGLDTGAGPFRLSSAGTLPGGLVGTVDYWALVVNADELRLALTQGDALTGVFVDLTSAGTGTHTMAGGLAPNLSEDYDLVVGAGNVGIVRVYEDATSQGAATDTLPDAPVTYQVRHKDYRPDGRYLTSVRFQDQLDGIAVTADVLRVYPDVDDAVVAEWKWLTGFGDDVGGFDAASSGTAPSPVTTAALTPTHQRFGLGGVRLDGTQGLEALGSGTATALQTFTFEIEVIPDATASGELRAIACGPQGGYGGLGDSWILYLDDTNECLSWTVLFADGTSWNAGTTNGTFPRGVPARITLRRDGATGTTDLFYNRTLLATDTRAAGLRYCGNRDANLGLGCGLFQSGAFRWRGVLGWARFSSVARSQAYLDAAYWLWRRNPIQLCRELATEGKRQVDATAFDAATVALDAVAGGTLKADGYLIDENELRAVLQAMVPFRDLAFGLNTSGQLTVSIATAPTTVQGSFGLGDDFNNLLDLPTRTPASLTEIARTLVVRFRRPRNVAGPFDGYEREIRRDCFPAGHDELALPLPFVDSAVTADVIADFRAKRMVSRQTVYDLELGHEGRYLERGDLLRLNVPLMGISDQDLEAIQLAKGAERVQVRAVSASSADFSYTPRPLPADPADRTLLVVDLGNAPSLSAVLANGRVTLTLVLADTQTLRPIANGPLVEFEGLTGAPTHWQAVAEAVADDSTSYVATTIHVHETFVLAPLPAAAGRIRSVTFLARMAALLQPNRVDLYMWNRTDRSGRFGTGWVIPATGVYADYTQTFTAYPMGNTPDAWTAEDLAALRAGIFVSYYGGELDLTQFAVTVEREHQQPEQGAYVEYLKVGPSASQPADPLETDPVAFIAEDFAPQVADLTGTSGDVYWWWARIRDEFGRMVRLVGPASVTIP